MGVQHGRVMAGDGTGAGSNLVVGLGAALAAPPGQEGNIKEEKEEEEPITPLIRRVAMAAAVSRISSNSSPVGRRTSVSSSRWCWTAAAAGNLKGCKPSCSSAHYSRLCSSKQQHHSSSRSSRLQQRWGQGWRWMVLPTFSRLPKGWLYLEGHCRPLHGNDGEVQHLQRY